jgi:putative ABC transport system permease protein
MQDLRYALRTLRKQPIFTLVAVITLTIGIGANAAIFSLFHHLLLRPLPYPDAERLVFIWNTYPLMGLDKATVSIPDYLDRKTQAPALADAALFTSSRVNLSGEGGQPEQLNTLVVTPSFFSTLGRQPARGRTFHEREAQPGPTQAAILTHQFWTSRFGADPGILDRGIRLNGVEVRVVGVLPPDFELPARDIALLTPFAFTPEQMADTGRGNEFSTMIGRLAPGATVEQLNAQMRTIVDRNLERLPQFVAFAKSSGFGGFAVPFRDELLGDDLPMRLFIIQGGVFLVLLIACANVANLLLMRATGRMRELAIRTTLGAGRWRLARQLLTEGLVLSALGAAGGIAVGYGGLRALLALGDQLPAMGEPGMQPAVLLFTVGLSVLTGVVFGLVPAVAILRGNASAFLKDESRSGTASRSTGMTRGLLVVGETALALTLVAGAGLLVKSFAQLQGVDPGFSTERIMTTRLSLPSTLYPDAPSRNGFWQRVLDQVRAIPGVTHAGFSTHTPFAGTGASGSYTIVGYTPPDGQPAPHGRQTFVGGEYFQALGISLLDGRLFTDSDTAEAPRVVIVDRYLVDRYFGGQSPLGREIQRGDTRMTIVGVVETTNTISLAEPVEKERLYYPAAQAPPASMVVLLKTAVDPASIVPALRAAVWSVDVEQPLADVRTVDQWLDLSLGSRRAPAVLLVVFGAVALALSAIGIYGVLAFGVAQRVREFGIRQALGADRRAILALVFTQGLRTTALGVAIGIGLSLLLGYYIRSQLFGVAPYDLQVLGGATLVLLAVAAIACYIPARRATRIEPMGALRDA